MVLYEYTNAYEYILVCKRFWHITLHVIKCKRINLFSIDENKKYVPTPR